MIILDATTKSLQFKLAAAATTNQLPFSSSCIDSTGSATTPGEQDGTSNNTTAVTLVNAPAASTQRLVKSFIIQNADTVAATVTVTYNNNSTLRNLFVATLNVGDQLVYEDGNGWMCVDKNGNVKTASPTSAVGQLPGTTTNDNASAGNVGEYVNSTIAGGSAVSLTSGTSANVTSISLTAGDWDVEGNVAFNIAGGTTVSFFAGGISNTSAVLPSTNMLILPGVVSASYDQSFVVPKQRFSLATTTTINLVADALFSGTCKAYGSISARRAR